MNDIDLSTDGRKAGMKAISLISPWWWFVLHAGKNLENRTWRHAPSYRGPLLIHASKTYVFRDVLDDMYTAADMVRRAGTSLAGRFDRITHDMLRPSLGCIVGKVDLVDVVTSSGSPWFVGPMALVLANPIAFSTPIPCRGERYLFDVDDHLVREAA